VTQTDLQTCIVNGVPYTHDDIRLLRPRLPESNLSAQALHAIGSEHPDQKYQLWDIADRLGLTGRTEDAQRRISGELGQYSQLIRRVLGKPDVDIGGAKNLRGVAWPIQLDRSAGTMTYAMPGQIAEES